MTTKGIIFICSRLPHGHHPKLRDFGYSKDHNKWIYLGRELTAEEFNEGCKKVFGDPKFGSYYDFSCQMIESAEAISATPEPKAEPAPAPKPEPAPQAVSAPQAAPFDDLKLEEDQAKTSTPQRPGKGASK